MNRKVLLGVLVAAFLVYAGWSFMDAVTPYVDVAAAKSASHTVQVKGLLDPSAAAPHMEGQDFLFSLRDETTGETLPVRYHGMKPDQFDEAHHIVAVGKCQDGVFRADKLLIKCPSKYERKK